MKRKIKKALVFTLLAAMLFSLVACGGGKTEQKQPETPSGQPAPNDDGLISSFELTGEVNKYGWNIPKETIRFSIYDCGSDVSDQAEEDARLEYVHQNMLEEFNVDITKYVYAQDPDERLNLMLASNNYPDVIVGLSDSMAEKFISQGKAIELSGYIEKYGPNIIAGYGNYLNLLRNEEGKLYKLSSGSGHTTDRMGKSFSIRYDLAKKVGVDVNNINSMEDWYQAVKKIIQQFPESPDGGKVYATTAFTEKGAEFFGAPLAFLGLYSTSTGYYKLNDDGKITFWTDTEEGLKVAKFMNKLWREGLIDPDFQTKDYDASMAFMSSERVAGNIGTWWHNYVGGHQIWETTEDDYTIDKRMQELTWEEAGAEPKLINDNFLRSARTIITNNCKNPDAVITYVNWEFTPLGVAYVAMGPEGPDRPWKLNADGLIEMNEKFWYGDPGNTSFLWDDWESDMGSFNYVVGAPGYTPESRVNNPAEGWAEPVIEINLWDPIPDYSKLDQDRLSVNNKVFLFDYARTKPYRYDGTMWTLTMTDDLNVIYQDVKDKLLEDWVLCMTAKSEAECEQLFRKISSDLRTLGLDTLIDAQQQAFSTNSAKFDGTYWNK